LDNVIWGLALAIESLNWESQFHDSGQWVSLTLFNRITRLLIPVLSRSQGERAEHIAFRLSLYPTYDEYELDLVNALSPRISTASLQDVRDLLGAYSMLEERFPQELRTVVLQLSLKKLQEPESLFFALTMVYEIGTKKFEGPVEALFENGNECISILARQVHKSIQLPLEDPSRQIHLYPNECSSL